MLRRGIRTGSYARATLRLALVSQPESVVRLVLFEAMRDVAIGTVAGLAGRRAVCVLARSMENVGAVDASTTGVSVALIAAAGIVAAFLPALRIMRVNPAEALRS